MFAVKQFVIGATSALALAALSANAASGRPVDFNRDIRPVLSDNCFHCHGPDEKQRKAKLRLDTEEGARKDLGGYAAIKPKDANASEVWKRITTKNEDDVMPPPDTHKSLKPEQIELIRRWIEQGAKYQGHWAFTTPVPPAPPKVKNSRWGKNPVDQFILARLEEKSLTPSSEAGKEILIRRVTLDLNGLPPTPAEIDAFLADKTPNAYERLVDRLLQSPRYGEHMARYWLDAARYGDTHGLHLDNERSMWPYRDWVVKAFNENMAFDQFTVWQLAGDLLPNKTREQQIASGFNRCNVTTSEGGSINEEFIYRYAVDRTETTAAVWMGLTAGCAVCHDHKFDPISTKEFYSMYAFFNSAADPAMDGNRIDTPPILKLTTPEQQEKIDAIAKQSAAVGKQIKAELKKFDYVDPATLTPPPPKVRRETVWVDDNLPPNVKTGGNGTVFDFVVIDGDVPPLNGKRCFRRKASGVEQDFFTGAEPFEITAGMKLFAHVFIDPKDPPKAIMLQYHTKEGWNNRANWGDEKAIPFGEKAARTKIQIAALPKTGEWVRLEINPATIGLKAGTKVDGMAFTQFGGMVHWDKAGWVFEANPATDPLFSISVWDKANQSKILKDAPKEISDILRSVKPADRTDEQSRKVREYYLEFVSRAPDEFLAPLRKERDALKNRQEEVEKGVPFTFVMADLPEPREAFVMIRGQYNKPGDKVTRSTPAFLPPMKVGQASRLTAAMTSISNSNRIQPETGETPVPQSTRLDLAAWLTDRKHPLTARVTVNRFWQQLFGTGLVKTSNDFGSQGDPPSHPELLDWLATNFMDNSWDMKKFMKLLVTSATYRQDSKVTKRHLEIDPENRLLARGPRFRLDAEVIRDGALFTSGLLVPTIGGKPVKPYQPENIWEPVAYSGSNTRFYKQDSGDALYRRSLYTFIKRTAPAPGMTTFDAPSREAFCVRRERSNTPLQALLLMNDVQYFEAARALAQRMMTEGGANPEQRVIFAFRLATGRLPTKNELAVLRDALASQLARYIANVEAAKQAITFGESKPKAELKPTELAAYTMVANLILNLDEALTKN
ncbi:MAG: PSD1 domain-containing protein [Verrucomicrobia bacterium]|nr:PSD1 domain-containing protein [Verrucomicrobiota bacterium]